MEVIPMTIVVQYGGEWKYSPELDYVGGTFKMFDEIPSDFNQEGLRMIINSLGYEDIIKLHYCDPTKSISDGVRFLSYDDVTFAKFHSLLTEYRLLTVYTEHEVDDEEQSAEAVLEVATGISRWLDEVAQSEGIGPRPVKKTDVILEGSQMDNLDEIDFDEEGSDEEDEELIEARKVKQSYKKKDKDLVMEELSIKKSAKKWKDDYVDLGQEGCESDSDSCPESPELSDEDDIGNLVPSKKMGRKRKKMTHSTHMLTLRADDEGQFFLGQQFQDATEFRNALTNYSVSVGRDVTYTKNTKTQIGARCRTYEQGCPWYIWASVDMYTTTMTVKSLVPKHVCGRVPKVGKVKARWIASNYYNKFRVNPYLKCQEIVDTMWSEYGIKVSLWLALKARRIAQDLILGEYSHQYTMLYRYAMEIKRANPANTIKFGLNQGQFRRLYICFAALKKGFLTGCRPFFGIDGCFLKGPFGGQLLVAVGRDGNNQMFPIAWACVEVEDTDSWEWFLQLLATDLDTIDGSGFTIMSDQQKGLLNAVSTVWPSAETRVCARHVYCNFRTKFGGGLHYRRVFWKVGKSTTENDFNANIEIFSTINKDAAQELLNKNYKKWVRAYQTPQCSCDSIDNNMSEVFNAYILGSRHKPIITMLEDIREGLMERLQKKRDYLLHKDIEICPRIQKTLEKAKVAARGWVAYWDGNFSYGVRDGGTQTRYVVSLLERTCSCNAWQLSGIPCKHAVTAIWKAMEHPEHYVSQWYSKTTYLKAYEFPLEPLNGPGEWPECTAPPIIPPHFKKLKHRPTQKRRPSVGEVEGATLSRKGQKHKCSLCRQQGHNKKTCPVAGATQIRPHTTPQQSQTMYINESQASNATPRPQAAGHSGTTQQI